MVELDVMVTAEIAMPQWFVFRRPGNPLTRLGGVMKPGGDALRAPCLAYAVRHPTAGTILIDTGMHPDASRDLRRDFGLPMSLMFRALRPAKEHFGDQLRGLGIDPAEVGQVVMTHLHVDHTSGMRLLPAAEFVCTRHEWEAAHGRLPAGKGYVSHHLPAEDRMRLLDIDRDGEPHGPFTKAFDLLGDGSIRLISTPGHTRGHLSVLLQLEGGRQALVVGDAAYTRRNIEEGILPMLTDDDEASLRSMSELKAFAHAEPDALLVPTHDPDAWRLLAGEHPGVR